MLQLVFLPAEKHQTGSFFLSFQSIQISAQNIIFWQTQSGNKMVHIWLPVVTQTHRWTGSKWWRQIKWKCEIKPWMWSPQVIPWLCFSYTQCSNPICQSHNRITSATALSNQSHTSSDPYSPQTLCTFGVSSLLGQNTQHKLLQTQVNSGFRRFTKFIVYSPSFFLSYAEGDQHVDQSVTYEAVFVIQKRQNTSSFPRNNNTAPLIECLTFPLCLSLSVGNQNKGSDIDRQQPRGWWVFKDTYTVQTTLPLTQVHEPRVLRLKGGRLTHTFPIPHLEFELIWHPLLVDLKLTDTVYVSHAAWKRHNATSVKSSLEGFNTHA